MQVKIDENKCTGCGDCAIICPVGAIAPVKGKAVTTGGPCARCGACVTDCPAGAMTIEK